MVKDVIFFVFVLIFIYLVVINGDKTIQIVNSLGNQFNDSIKNLQGRN